jgi:hypothetical protein
VYQGRGAFSGDPLESYGILTLDQSVLVRIQVRQLPAYDVARKRESCLISLGRMEDLTNLSLWFLMSPR